MYVDVHTHLTHTKFDSDRESVITRAKERGLEAIVVNGLEPVSNRMILEMAAAEPVIRPALGIYPIDAVNDRLPSDLPYAVPQFDVDEELNFIRTQAESGHLAAIGECGLDAHWVGESTFERQEYVFETLIEIATQNQLPLIIHTRKRELRSAEILKNQNVRYVNFHCYGGRTKFAKQWAEEHGWWFSIPANSRNNQAFAKMLKILPKESILTETDAPFLAPVRGERSEPSFVVDTVAHLAEIRDLAPQAATDLVWDNYKRLFRLT